jgi:hypothetical protein
MRLKFFPISWLLLIVAGSLVSATAQPVAPVERSEDDLLLMALVVDGVPLSEDFETYAYPEGLLVPLGELCRLLELGITVDPRAGTAVGFIVRPERKFSLDLAKGEVVVSGKASPVDRSKVEPHLQDLYVDTELLGEWLPVTLQVNRFGSVIVVQPREPLPLQMRLERERRSQQLPAYQQVTDRGYPHLDNPYKLFSPPAIDQTLTLGNLASQGGGFTARGSTYMTGDLLGMNAEFYGYLDSSSSAPGVQLQLKRTDPEAKLLGPLKAREINLGDVFAPPLPMLTSTSSGRGLVISRFPLYQQQQYDLQTFRGRILAGWDVELYRDGLLIGYEHDPQSGEYEFPDVPLYFGLNRFILVFYGPRGEKRTEERVFFVGESLTPPGESYYRMAYTEPDYGGSRLQWQHELGLRRDLSLSDTLLHLDLGDETRDYLGLGLRGFLRGWSLRGDLVKDLSGGSAVQAAAQTRLGDAALNIELRGLDNLHSEVYSDTGDPLRLQAMLQADGIRLPRALRLQPASLTATYDRYESGANATTATLRLSTVAQGLWLSNYLNWQRREFIGAPTFTQMTGSLLASRRYEAFTARSEVQYELVPEMRFSRVALDLQSRLKRNYQVNFSLSHSLLDDRETFVSLGVTYKTGSVFVGPAVAYSDSPSKLSGGLDLATSLLREPRSGRWQARPEASAAFGSASVRVFLDRDRDGRFSAGDQPLPEVTLVVNGLMESTETNAEGIAFLTGLPVDQPTDLSVAEGSLQEPLWAPDKPGVRFTSRPGNVMEIDFAIAALAEVSGTVYLELEGKRRELAGVPVELVDGQGKVVAQDRSAYDGFYVLSKVPPGVYQLRLTPAETQRLGLQPLSREIAIPAEGGFMDSVDLVVTPATDSAAQTAPSSASETP